ncbi:TPA: hypothetical protein HA318_00485, partial [Candidatus Micrarchaeota archaeon]|nr:hypothetical protein [Candidatus Micrarchaeota archaeon]
MNETHRQLAHVAAGTAVLVSVLTWGGQETLAALIALVCAGMAFATVKLLGFSLGPLEKLLARFERAKA